MPTRRDRLVDEGVVDVRCRDAVDPELVGQLAPLMLVVAALRLLQGGHERRERPLVRLAPSGMPVQTGSSRSARFTFAHGPAILIAATSSRKSPGRSPSSSMPRNVRFGSGVRDHDAGDDLRTVVEHDADGSPVASRSAGRSIRPDLCAGLGRRRRHRSRDRAHAADHVAVETLHLVLTAREHVEHQPIAVPGR